MNAAGPWWAPALFAVIGALPTLLITTLNRRSERHRLSRETKEAAYPELHRVAEDFVRMPVWPVEAADPDSARRELDALAQRVSFFGPSKVSRRLPDLLTAAEQHGDTINQLRAETRPAYDNAVDQRHVAVLNTSAQRLHEATTQFAEAARRDLEIRTKYRPAREVDT